MKRISLFLITFLLYASCEEDQSIRHHYQTKGVIITTLEQDTQAKQLFESILSKSNSGRLQDQIELTEIYKYFDVNKDITNYSVSLPDTSDAYFDNLVVSKIGDSFYGFILRYRINEEQLSDDGFSGIIDRYNLDGDLIGTHHVPASDVSTGSGASNGRTKFISQCVVGYQSFCWQEYKVSTATGLPIPETMTTVCASEAVYGWCGDNAGPMPRPEDNGWGTYIPTTAGGTNPSGTQADPEGPNIVPTKQPSNYRSPVVIIEDEAATTSKANFLIDKWENSKIDDTELNKCMQPVVAALKDITNGSLGQIIQKFSGDTPGFNWKLKDGQLPADQNAFTSSLYDRTTGTITTTFDGRKFKKSTDLAVARTILHEAIHAYLTVYFKVDPSSATISFPQLVDDFKKNSFNGNLNSVQHAEFVRNFISQIALALEDFGKSKGYDLSKQFYEDLAWGGLTHTGQYDASGTPIESSWFKSAVPNATDRKRIVDVITVEQTGSTLQGVPKSQKGTNANC